MWLALMKVLGVLLILPLAVDAHGFLTIPKSRQELMRAPTNGHKADTEYCPHCYNGGLPGLVQALTPGDGLWPAVETTATSVRHGLGGDAGDAASPKYNPWPADATIVATYTQGQSIEIEVDVSTHHAGHVEFRLCDASTLSDPTMVTQECLNQHLLVRDPADEAAAPIDPAYPHRGFLTPACETNPQWKNAPRSDYGRRLKFKYLLPAAVSCSRCVLQYYYLTGNSCLPPGYTPFFANHNAFASCIGDGGSRGYFNPVLSTCGAPGAPYPEEFWNLADIAIQAGGASPTPPAAAPGCDGVAGSNKKEDLCGVCGGDGTSCRGCDGIANSGKVAGLCGCGDSTSCLGCDGVANSLKVNDACGVCGGDGQTCSHGGRGTETGIGTETGSSGSGSSGSGSSGSGTAGAVEVLQTTRAGDSLARFNEFVDKLTTVENGGTTRAVHSSGGAAGGVVSEGQGYGVLIGGVTAGALGSSHAAFKDVVDKTYGMAAGWMRMAELSAAGSGSCQSTPLCGASCRGGQGTCFPCLPHWKFDDRLERVVGTGSAADGDADGILGMILLVLATQRSKVLFPWWRDTAKFAYDSCQQFYNDDTTGGGGGGGQRIVKLGSCWGGFDCQNPSYHAPAAYRACRDYMAAFRGTLYGGAEPDMTTAWNEVVATTYAVLQGNQCPSSGLSTNWYVPNHADLRQPGTTACSGSGTPPAEFGSEAGRGVWRIAADYAWYGAESEGGHGVGFPDGGLTPQTYSERVVRQVVAKHEPTSAAGFAAALDLPASCLVESVHPSWEWNAFMWGPVLSSLLVPAASVGRDAQLAALATAGDRLRAATIDDYYSGSWIAIATTTLNGDLQKVSSLLANISPTPAAGGGTGSTPSTPATTTPAPTTPAPATPAPATPAPALPAPPAGGSAEKRMVAFIENWKACPTDAQVAEYTHVLLSFAVSYVWRPGGNQCDATCRVTPTVPICGNAWDAARVARWQSQLGTKVLLSFGGAGMGGSWAGDRNYCWDACINAGADDVAAQLVQIVRDQSLDGVDIDYEYFFDGRSNAPGGAAGMTAAKQRRFVADLSTKLKAALPAGRNIVTHTPMDGDLNAGKPYFDIIKDVAPSVDFLMPQYYNGPFRPVQDMAPALVNFRALKDQAFGGDASRIVFGFCINDCAGTGSNTNKDQVLAPVATLAQQEPSNGGIFFWAASADVGGAWTVNARAALLGDAPSAPVMPTPPPAVKDVCGVVGGDGSTCQGCDGVPNSGKTTNSCGMCGAADAACPTAQCAGIWKQCGGKTWQGATCCDQSAGLECVRDSQWYSQCLKATATRAPTTPATTPAPTTPANTPAPATPAPATPAPATPAVPETCSLRWKQCGGKNWQGPLCCESGTMCVSGNPWYSQCRPVPKTATALHIAEMHLAASPLVLAAQTLDELQNPGGGAATPGAAVPGISSTKATSRAATGRPASAAPLAAGVAGLVAAWLSARFGC